MSTNNHFHLMKGVKFSKELLSDLETEVGLNKSLISEHYFCDDTILINFKHSDFESLFVTTDYEKTIFKIPFPDGSLYSGFKFRSGKTNALALKIMLLIKYHVKDKVVISSEGSHEGLSRDFDDALDYLYSKGYNIKAESRCNNDAPYIFINGEEVLNIYDESGDIFNSMFTLVHFD